MRIRPIAVGMLATVAACSGGGPGQGGSAGTSGSGGAGSLPACGGAGDSSSGLEFAVTGSDGIAFLGNVTAAVTVSAVDSCATAGCPSGAIPGSGVQGAPSIDTRATRFLLTAADARTWMLYLRNTAMPSDVVKEGDTFDMTLFGGLDTSFDSTLGQTIVLAHGATLVVFASSDNKFGLPRPPDLDVFGIAVTDGGALCQGAPDAFDACTPVQHAARVAIGTDSTTVPSGTTKQLDWLSFTNDVFLELRDSGNCDAKGSMRMAGFRVP